jgi:hypothetical protein
MVLIRVQGAWESPLSGAFFMGENIDEEHFCMPRVFVMVTGLILAASALAQAPAPTPVPKAPPPAMGVPPKAQVTTQQLESIKKEAQAQTGKQSGPQLDQELNRRAQSHGFPSWDAMSKAARP